MTRSRDEVRGDAARRVVRLRAEALAWERRLAPMIEALPAEARESARNLVHYASLRSHDLRVLQDELADLGLSSLGRAESRVLSNLDSILGNLLSSCTESAEHPPGITRSESARLLAARTDALFGPPPEGRHVRIMVTIPEEAAAPESRIIHDLVSAGMDCLRINCAHGDPELWKVMIAHARDAEREFGRHCSIAMDLSGPRVRLGELEPGPRVITIVPPADEVGNTLEPARVALVPEGSAARVEDASAIIPISPELIAGAGPGDAFRIADPSGAEREVRVRSRAGDALIGEVAAPLHAVTGARVTRVSADGVTLSATIGTVPPVERRLRLAPGDRLVLTRDQSPGTISPAVIPIVPAEVLDDLTPGDPIWFDEGRVGGVVDRVTRDSAEIRITQGRSTGETLRGQKGINLPATHLRMPSLTQSDIELLPFIVRHADLIGYSFVRSAGDVDELRARLEALGSDIGVLLKIETVQAFDALPEILLAGLRLPKVGVMIARGDLAVECGFERLAEVQEEILWLCEAAHLPVVWATQVLEDLAKRGRPSRAEVTDAAAGARAECVMLNKGPHVVLAVRALGSILERMAAHQDKKQSLLRELHVAERFLVTAGGGWRPGAK